MDNDVIVLAGQQALWTTVLVGGPMLGVMLVVGLAIALVQALTQIQEQALAFVPKLISLGLVMLFGASAAMGALRSLTEGLFDQIIAIGGLR
jgi:flagellar biosynthetic protein FliQ